MLRSISADRLALLVGDFARAPAYAGLADALTELVGDGRLPLDTRLPSERDLSAVLGLSRTTVTRAYAQLVAAGYAQARQGAGTFTRVPGGRGRVHDRVLMPGRDQDVVDLTAAAGSAPPGIAAAYAAAAGELPAYLSGHGYFPAGLPVLQEAIAAGYDARGLPTSPEQIMVTPGALAASAIVANALLRRGDRVLVESPTYPNAVDAIRHAGGRLVVAPIDATGWDLPGTLAAVRQTRPGLAYLIPDFQNPTGLVMSAAQREEYAAGLADAGATALVDEAHQALLLDGEEMPPPFAAFARRAATITVGSASKSFWGGLRLGWIRVAHPDQMAAVTSARVRLDLGAPVFEQLVLTRLLADPGPVLAANRERLRLQREALVSALRAAAPDWSFRVPAGGLCLWIRLPRPVAGELVARAERAGVVVAPGPVFAADGGLDRFIRIPWTRPPDELRAAVAVLAEAWAGLAERPGATARGRDRVIVA